MKQHHLSFKGYPLEARIEIERAVASLDPYIRAMCFSDSVRLAALAEVFVSVGGPALEATLLSELDVFSLITEMRTVLARRKLRPEVAPREAAALSAIGRRGGAVSITTLEQTMTISRNGLNGVLRTLLKKEYVRREICKIDNRTVGLWSLTPRGQAYHAEHPIAATPIVSVVVRGFGLLPPSAPALRDNPNAWASGGRGPKVRR